MNPNEDNYLTLLEAVTQLYDNCKYVKKSTNDPSPICFPPNYQRRYTGATGKPLEKIKETCLSQKSHLNPNQTPKQRQQNANDVKYIKSMDAAPFDATLKGDDAEIKLLDHLKMVPDNEMIVFGSVGIKPREPKLEIIGVDTSFVKIQGEGEADFVVISESGIMIIEVKSLPNLTDPKALAKINEAKKQLDKCVTLFSECLVQFAEKLHGETEKDEKDSIIEILRKLRWTKIIAFPEAEYETANDDAKCAIEDSMGQGTYFCFKEHFETKERFLQRWELLKHEDNHLPTRIIPTVVSLFVVLKDIIVRKSVLVEADRETTYPEAASRKVVVAKLDAQAQKYLTPANPQRKTLLEAVTQHYDNWKYVKKSTNDPSPICFPPTVKGDDANVGIKLLDHLKMVPDNEMIVFSSVGIKPREPKLEIMGVDTSFVKIQGEADFVVISESGIMIIKVKSLPNLTGPKAQEEINEAKKQLDKCVTLFSESLVRLAEKLHGENEKDEKDSIIEILKKLRWTKIIAFPEADDDTKWAIEDSKDQGSTHFCFKEHFETKEKFLQKWELLKHEDNHLPTGIIPTVVSLFMVLKDIILGKSVSGYRKTTYPEIEADSRKVVIAELDAQKYGSEKLRPQPKSRFENESALEAFSNQFYLMTPEQLGIWEGPEFQVIEGPPGSGKTLLLMFKALEIALGSPNEQGRTPRVVLICPEKLIARHYKSFFEKFLEPQKVKIFSDPSPDEMFEMNKFTVVIVQTHSFSIVKDICADIKKGRLNNFKINIIKYISAAQENIMNIHQHINIEDLKNERLIAFDGILLDDSHFRLLQGGSELLDLVDSNLVATIWIVCDAAQTWALNEEDELIQVVLKHGAFKLGHLTLCLRNTKEIATKYVDLWTSQFSDVHVKACVGHNQSGGRVIEESCIPANQLLHVFAQHYDQLLLGKGQTKKDIAVIIDGIVPLYIELLIAMLKVVSPGNDVQVMQRPHLALSMEWSSVIYLRHETATSKSRDFIGKTRAILDLIIITCKGTVEETVNEVFQNRNLIDFHSTAEQLRLAFEYFNNNNTEVNDERSMKYGFKLLYDNLATFLNMSDSRNEQGFNKQITLEQFNGYSGIFVNRQLELISLIPTIFSAEDFHIPIGPFYRCLCSFCTINATPHMDIDTPTLLQQLVLKFLDKHLTARVEPNCEIKESKLGELRAAVELLDEMFRHVLEKENMSPYNYNSETIDEYDKRIYNTIDAVITKCTTAVDRKTQIVAIANYFMLMQSLSDI